MPTPNNNTNTPTVNANSEPQPEQTEQFKLAFEQLAAERAALDEESIVRINVDVPSTVNLVFAHLPQIGALASEVKALPSFDFARFEKLETYAQALAFAQMLHNAASKPIEHVPEMAAVVAGAVRTQVRGPC